jgi:hypothetical protein
MVKLYSNMPAELEKYNPEDVFTKYTQNFQSFDENGALHSYNDEPSKVRISRTGRKDLIWHSHGKAYRNSDKPSHISLSSKFFITLDEDEEKHSYNGMPSQIDFYNDITFLEWSNHGVTHREGDLPAEVTSTQEEVLEYVYYEQGIVHRANNQPSMLADHIKSWYVKGTPHNAISHSTIEEEGYQLDNISIYKTWHLYGVRLKEETFNSIKSFETENRVPLWVAFLYKLNVIGDTEISFFLKELNTWDGSFPMSWVFKTCGITDEVYDEKVKMLYRIDGQMFDKKRLFPLEPVLKVVEFERINGNGKAFS